MGLRFQSYLYGDVKRGAVELNSDSRTSSALKVVPKIGLILCFLFILLSVFGHFNKLESGALLSLKFRFREWVARTPPLNPALRILALDDATTFAHGRPFLSEEEWLKLFKTIAKRKPRVIVVDKVFSIFNPERYPTLVEELKHLDAPIALGSFLSNEENRYRYPVSFQSFFDFGVESQKLDQALKYYYGPAPQLMASGLPLSLGHLNGLKNGYVELFKQGPLGQIVPHLALSALVAGNALDESLKIKNQVGPFSEDSYLKTPNFPKLTVLHKNTLSLNGILARALQNIDITSVRENEVVLILPEMYTGSGDYSDTPIGRIQGGYVVASLINDFLNGEHLFSWSFKWWLLLPLIAFFMLIHRVKSAAAAILIGLAALSVLFCTALLGFAYLSLNIPVLGFSGFIFISMLTASISSKRIQDSLRLFARALEEEKKRVELHLKEASAMATILPQNNKVTLDKCEVTSFHKFFEYASGDWYAVEVSPSKRYLHVLLADVTGHGVQAALVVASCKTVLSCMLLDSNKKVLESEKFIEKYAHSLNQVLIENGDGRHTTTLTALTIDLETLTCSFIIASNPFIHLYAPKAEKMFKPLVQANNALGMDASAVYQSSVHVIHQGESIILSSDGIGISGRRLSLLIQEIALGPFDASAIGRRIIEERRHHIDDDLTLICIQF